MFAGECLDRPVVAVVGGADGEAVLGQTVLEDGPRLGVVFDEEEVHDRVYRRESVTLASLRTVESS